MRLNKLFLSLFAGLFLSYTAHAQSLTSLANQTYEMNSETAKINSLYELLQYQQNAKTNSKKMLSAIEQQARETAMKEYAYSLAIKTAITSQLGKAHDEVKANSRNLDAIYNFEQLMIQGKVVPPVITEARNLYNQNTPHQIRLSGAVYDIYAQARFSSTAPNWRDYLVFPNERDAYELIAFGATGFEPKNDRERKIWVTATKQGWDAGVAQANDMVITAMDRLNRDYIGMTRFHTFVAQGRISMPVISSYNLYDSNLGERLVLDERLLQIQTLPTFKTPDSLTQRQAQGLPVNHVLSMDTPKRAKDLALDKPQNEGADKLVTKIINGQSITELPFDEVATKTVMPKLPYEQPLNVTIERKYIFPAQTTLMGADGEQITLGANAGVQELNKVMPSVHDTIGQPPTPSGLIIGMELPPHDKSPDTQATALPNTSSETLLLNDEPAKEPKMLHKGDKSSKAPKPTKPPKEPKKAPKIAITAPFDFDDERERPYWEVYKTSQQDPTDTPPVDAVTNP